MELRPALLVVVGLCVLLLRPRPLTSAERAAAATPMRILLRPLPQPLLGTQTGGTRSLPNASTVRVANQSSHGALATTVASFSSSTTDERIVHALTFADRPNVYLHALAASVWHFNEGRPLLVLGLNARRVPVTSGRWNMTRHAIKGADPGKLKKIWFVGALLDDTALLTRLGVRQNDLLLFLDAFDCIVQRPLQEFGRTWAHLVRGRLKLQQTLGLHDEFIEDAEHSAGDGLAERRVRDPSFDVSSASLESLEAEAVVLLAEHSCWPWPLPGMARVGRPRGVSMAYMENRTFDVRQYHQGQRREQLSRVDAVQMCSEVKRRAYGGLWSYANSGVFAGTVRGLDDALRRLHSLAMAGHFEDQGMFHLTMLQHPRGTIILDSNASLFASQFAYNGLWWERPACFDDYFAAAQPSIYPSSQRTTSSTPTASGSPPKLLATGQAPFALHFNGPAGRFRLGWCIAATLHRTSRPGQHYLDLDRGGAPVPLPTYCDGGRPTASGLPKGANPPTGKQAVGLSPCPALGSTQEVAGQGQAQGVEARPRRLNCINDRCWLGLV